jgi:hypothetical protein
MRKGNVVHWNCCVLKVEIADPDLDRHQHGHSDQDRHQNDSDPDRHQNDSDPDRHQNDADPQHWLKVLSRFDKKSLFMEKRHISK